ncbi:MAG: uroporphyrinogen-III synthase [Pseudomonadota bacterium]
MASILLTRPISRASALAARFESAGHTVFHAPVTDIQTVAPPQVSIKTIDGLLFTSASAAAHMPEAAVAALRGKPCFATGPATADALSGLGFATIDHFDGDITRLLSALKMKVKTYQRRWLYPCGTDLSHAPEEMMDQTGAEITPWPVYSAVDTGLWADDLVHSLRMQRFDWSLFLSVRTADLFVRNIRSAHIWQDGAPGAAGAISTRVAETIAPLGFSDIRIGQEKTTSSLVAAMGLT